MQIDRVLYPIHSLGPGERLVIWCVGCGKGCKNCSNPELWEWDEAKNMDVKTLMDEVAKRLDGQTVDGVTITGGDPMEQFDALRELLVECESVTDDVLLYTGYTYEECVGRFGSKAMEELKGRVAVLIDGRYMEGENDGTSVLRGSNNQKMHYFKPRVRQKYEAYMSQGRMVQNVIYQEGLISVGIHGVSKTEGTSE